MNAVLVIAGRDLKSLVRSPMYFVIAAMCTTLWAAMYILSLQEFVKRSTQALFQGRGEGGGSLHREVFAQHISLVNFIMILAIAAIAMRLLAEEKKNRTYDLLLTSPVTATQIVLGKLLAGTGAAWSLIALSALYPISVRVFAPIDWGPLGAAYLGMMLLAAGYVAVGLFASSLTDSPVLAVVMSLIFSVGIWFVGAGAGAFDDQTVSKVFEQLSVGTHFNSFVVGAIGTSSLVFFASLIFLCAFLTQRVVESSRWR